MNASHRAAKLARRQRRLHLKKQSLEISKAIAIEKEQPVKSLDQQIVQVKHRISEIQPQPTTP